MQLYIGNKNYSSWSLRSWLLLRALDIPFEEKKLRLTFGNDPAFKALLAPVSPVGKVPVLVDDGFSVWDTLAITEYVADKLPDAGVWPADRLQRARARALCAEMHSGFGALRNVYGMNVEADLSEVGRRLWREDAASRADVERIDAMFGEQLGSSGGPFLFGAFGGVDAYFAPVCTRLRTYGLPVSPATAAYVERVLSLPAMREWIEDALAEQDFLPFDEPYRASRG